MSNASTFRIAIGAGIVFIIIALAAFANHFLSSVAHPAFGAKVGILCLIIALGCGIYANYNRPARASGSESAQG